MIVRRLFGPFFIALHPQRYDVQEAALYARLPLQALLIWWAWQPGRD